MLLIIGTYRKRDYVERALASIDRYVFGVDRIVFVDDSGDPEHSRWLSLFGEVSETHARGYNAAMQEVCRIAGEDAFAFWEEDFEALDLIDLENMAYILENRPHLAQLALLRGPHFPLEREHGGVLEALNVRIPGSVHGEREGVIEQTGTFTCNPAVWAPGIAARGWPEGRWSEDRMRDLLLADGYRFGFVPGMRVSHDGIRSGKGY